MTRTIHERSGAAGSVGDEALRHPPKPATVGLGPGNQPAAARDRNFDRASADLGDSSIGYRSGDPLRHPPKPATMGLGPHNEPADEGSPEGSPRFRWRSGNGHVAPDQRSVADLIKELRDEAMRLMRQELLLARTEAAEKASFFGKQAAKVGAGGAVLMIGSLLLLSALACFIAWIFAAAWEWHTTSALAAGYGIVGIVMGIVGYAMYASAVAKMRREPLVPERTLQSLKDDKQWLTQKTSATGQ